MAYIEHWRLVARNMLYAIAPKKMYMAVIVALALDIMTTLWLLNQGWGMEANPIYSVGEWNMAANLGLLRGGVCGAVLAWTYRRKAKNWQMAIILVICAIPVFNNLILIGDGLLI